MIEQIHYLKYQYKSYSKLSQFGILFIRHNSAEII